MAYNMRHALTGFAQTWKNLALVLEKSSFCPGIVLEFCKIILDKLVFEKYKNTTSPFRIMGYVKNWVKIAKKKLNENR